MAAQEMSGWWSLTSTTKADSAQPAVLGGRSAAPWVEKSSAVEKKHWWCRQVLYTEYYGCLQKVLPRAIPETHPRTTQSTASLSCVFSSCVYPF